MNDLQAAVTWLGKGKACDQREASERRNLQIASLHLRAAEMRAIPSTRQGLLIGA
jgi:hypothetical protein